MNGDTLFFWLLAGPPIVLTFVWFGFMALTVLWCVDPVAARKIIDPIRDKLSEIDRRQKADLAAYELSRENQRSEA